jgi:hypothetical protein
MERRVSIGALVRRVILWCGLTLLATGAAHAQVADTVQRIDTLSYDDAAEVAYRYNLPAALRSTTDLTIDSTQSVAGSVAVLEGSLILAGHVTGNVTVINGDATLRPGARIDGDLVVTGGQAKGVASGSVGGVIKVYRPTLSYRVEEDQVVAVHDESRSIANWFRRWKRRHISSQSRLVLKGGTYNRVEGLPILFGPSIRQNSSLGRLSVEALGIYRSADNFAWKGENLGYTASAEMQFGVPRGIAVGAEAFDVVEGVEPWHLRDSEVGLASFFLRRDYRNYYDRHGARGYVAWRNGRGLDLTLAIGQELWGSRAARAPFTLLRNSSPWRDNPVLDDGRFTISSATTTFDTRNNVENPWTGWLISATVEHGWSSSVRLGPTSADVRAPASAPVPVSYTWGFLDARRYNRVSPRGQLNLRLILGGWLGGDPLPLERRFSLGGAGTLPGYDFREHLSGEDVLTCGGNAVPGAPALCERVALAQAEYRGNLPFRIFGGGDTGGWSWTFYHPVQWVLFADAGRGWLVHEQVNGVTRSAAPFPSLGTFKSDIGIGLDAEVLGIFVAKSLTDPRNAPNFVLRLRHRF